MGRSGGRGRRGRGSKRSGGPAVRRARRPLYATPDRQVSARRPHRLGRPHPRTGLTAEQTLGLTVGAVALTIALCAALAALTGVVARTLASDGSLAPTMAETAGIAVWLAGAVAFLGGALWAVLFCVERAAVALRRRRRVAARG